MIDSNLAHGLLCMLTPPALILSVFSLPGINWRARSAVARLHTELCRERSWSSCRRAAGGAR